MDKIKVISILRKENTIEVKFDVTNGLAHFWKDFSFFCKYEANVERVPDGIAIIPFVCNVLPIIWLTNSELEIDSLDESFFESIPQFKQGYIDMYPKLTFSGKITVRTIKQFHYASIKKHALFFSGGADAYASLVAHADEHPELLLIRGADIDLNDDIGWTNVSKCVSDAAAEFSITQSFITSNFRWSLDQVRLDAFVEKTGDSWWHGFQHGIALIGQAAPLAFLHGFSTIFIASSFTAQDKLREDFSCASDPTIDNFVRFGDTVVIHDQFDFCRQEKISHICEYSKKTSRRISLHVCWQSKGGKNCCHCEKCYRTIMEIVAEGANPTDYGFDVSIKMYKQLKKDILENINIPFTSYWEEIKLRFIENNDLLKDNPQFRWVYTTNMKKLNSGIVKRIKNVLRNIKRYLKSFV